MGNFTLGASISKISTLVSQVGLTTLARAHLGPIGPDWVRLGPNLGPIWTQNWVLMGYLWS